MYIYSKTKVWQSRRSDVRAETSSGCPSPVSPSAVATALEDRSASLVWAAAVEGRGSRAKGQSSPATLRVAHPGHSQQETTHN